MTVPLLEKAAGSHLWCAVISLSLCAFAAAGKDWPQYRGANHDGVSTDLINTNWSGSVTNPVWLVPVTNGLSSFAVGGGRAYTQIRRTIAQQDKEVCVALSITDGTELWSFTVDDAQYDGGVGYDDGPRSTPTLDQGSVYLLSSYLKLYRLDATNGGVIWQKDLIAIYGGSVIGWQNAASPLLDDGVIYVNANCGSSTLLALHVIDGSLAWASQDEAMTHSTPVLATIHGVRQVIFAAQSGLVSLDPKSGSRLWSFPYPFHYSTSLAMSPVVFEDVVFIGGAHSYGMGSVAVQANLSGNSWSAQQLWSTNNPASHWMTPVAYQGFLYGQFGIQQFDTFPSTQLKCIDIHTGTVRWSTNNFGHGGTLLVNGFLVILTEMGDLVLAQPSPDAYIELGRFQAIPGYSGDNNKCWNSPAIADGKIYARSTAFGACYDLSITPPSSPLKLEAFFRPPSNNLQLTLRTIDETPIDSNRLAHLELRTSTDATVALPLWSRITNSLVLTNGQVQINDLEIISSQFFIGNELR